MKKLLLALLLLPSIASAQGFDKFDSFDSFGDTPQTLLDKCMTAWAAAVKGEREQCDIRLNDLNNRAIATMESMLKIVKECDDFSKRAVSDKNALIARNKKLKRACGSKCRKIR